MILDHCGDLPGEAAHFFCSLIWSQTADKHLSSRLADVPFFKVGEKSVFGYKLQFNESKSSSLAPDAVASVNSTSAAAAAAAAAQSFFDSPPWYVGSLTEAWNVNMSTSESDDTFIAGNEFCIADVGVYSSQSVSQSVSRLVVVITC